MTKMRDVKGFAMDTKSLRYYAKITVRTTRDERGQTLSLADEKNGIMLCIPVEPVLDMIEVK